MHEIFVKIFNLFLCSITWTFESSLVHGFSNKSNIFFSRLDYQVGTKNRIFFLVVFLDSFLKSCHSFDKSYPVCSRFYYCCFCYRRRLFRNVMMKKQ